MRDRVGVRSADNSKSSRTSHLDDRIMISPPSRCRTAGTEPQARRHESTSTSHGASQAHASPNAIERDLCVLEISIRQCLQTSVEQLLYLFPMDFSASAGELAWCDVANAAGTEDRGWCSPAIVVASLEQYLDATRTNLGRSLIFRFASKQLLESLRFASR
jgi:hypothetical protein